MRPRFKNLQTVFEQQLFRNVCAVYVIRCKKTGDCYIGTCECLFTRLKAHANQPSFRVRRSFEKYGLDNHEVAVLEHCSTNSSSYDRRLREAFWIWNSSAKLNSEFPFIGEDGKLTKSFYYEFTLELSDVYKAKKKLENKSFIQKSKTKTYSPSQAKVADLTKAIQAYQSLAQEHFDTFSPIFNSLRQRIEQQVDEIRVQEKALLDAQNQQLHRIHRTIKADARILLTTPGFQDFIRNLKQEQKIYEEQSDLIEIDDRTSSWMLNFHHPLKLKRFRIIEEAQAYDYEKVKLYTSYEYALVLEVGEAKAELQVQIGRLHYTNPSYYETCGYREQQWEIFREISHSLREISPEPEKTAEFLEELSCLICYACSLLAITPQPLPFAYS